jgi:hypothetical protein
MKAVTALALLCALSPSRVVAHDFWPDGSIVQDWIKAQCCGINEAHRYRDDQVHPTGTGNYWIEGVGLVTQKPSPTPINDGYWYLFFPAGEPTMIRCFFAPFNF